MGRRRRKSRRYNVSADLSPWHGYSRPALRGVLRYAAGAAHWDLHSSLSERFQAAEPGGDAGGRIHGRIIWAMNASYRAQARRWGIKAVAIRDRFEEDRVPTVTPDNPAVGALAGEYLLGLGYTRFVTVGALHNTACRRRLEGFTEAVEAAGARVQLVPAAEAPDAPAEPVPPAEWLRELRAPCAAFCWTDEAAHVLISAAKAAGLAVPDDLAVMGVHNDDLICESIRPSITSVALPMEQVGYEAAALLDRLLAGQREPDRPIRLPPVGIVERDSTRTTAIEDPAVLAAVGIIRRQAIEGLTVEGLCEQMDPPVSRRTLERRFGAVLGRSPHEEIRRRQCHHAQELLVNTRLTQEEIARRCGFSSSPFFSNTFKRVVGTRPGAYRRARQR